MNEETQSLVATASSHFRTKISLISFWLAFSPLPHNALVHALHKPDSFKMGEKSESVINSK